MPRIFISYRRDDSLKETEIIYAVLAQKFGSDNVFRDVATIQPGLNWDQAIAQAVYACDVLLVVIGSQWATILDETTERPRLYNEGDWVRYEIRQALLLDKHVIPVMVNDAKMPDANNLPPNIIDLHKKNAFLVADDERLGIEIKRLSKIIENLPIANPSSNSFMNRQTVALSNDKDGFRYYRYLRMLQSDDSIFLILTLAATVIAVIIFESSIVRIGAISGGSIAIIALLSWRQIQRQLRKARIRRYRKIEPTVLRNFSDRDDDLRTVRERPSSFSENVDRAIRLRRRSLAELIWIDDDERHPLIFDNFPFIFGRVPPFDERVSRRHFLIDMRSGNFFVMDLNSQNGTYLNDKLLTPESEYELNNGDVISVSDYDFIFSTKLMSNDVSN